MDVTSIPHGQCQCGCGQTAPLAPFSYAPRGWVKGQPLRFVKGHIGGINATKVYLAKFSVDENGNTTKFCTWCKKQHPVAEFDKGQHDPSKLRSHCKECQRERARNFYKKNPEPYLRRSRADRHSIRQKLRSRVRLIKEMHGCRACGERDICCLDFHHLLGKDRNIGGCSTVRRFERELVKCVVLCATCHRKSHAGHLLISSEILCAATDGREESVAA